MIGVQAIAEISEDTLKVEAGKPLPSEKGLYFSRGEKGFVNLRIEDNQFAVIFLNSEKEVVQPENLVDVLLIAEAIRGEDDRENFLLRASPSGLLYSHPRYIKKPYHYRVKVRVTFTEQFQTPTTASGHDNKEVVEEFGFAMLKQ